MPGSRPHFSAAVSNWRIAMRNELRSSVVLMGTGTRALAIIEDSFPPTMKETQSGDNCASGRRGAIYTPKSMDVEAPGGVEPPTRSLGNCCSIHLSYGARLDDNKLSHDI